MTLLTIDTNKPIYLIYCRVSSQRQVNEGDGLGSQEKRCLDWVKSKDGVVEKIFRDEGVSGGLFDRPAMGCLIAYIDAHQNKNYVVVFDDLARLARQLSVHLRLRMELVNKRGVKLECLNFNFDDSPQGEFIEMVMASSAQLARAQNRQQVIQKQQARLERGYWSFCPPLGLKNVRTKEDGKVLVPAEPYATIFKEAIEGYERNLLVTQDEVKKFIVKQYKEHGITRNASIHGVQETLRNPLYAGYVEYLPWKVERREGKHKGIISKETYQNVQDKLLGRTKVHLRKDYSLDFPLRSWVACNGCGNAYTASWVGGRTKRYPTYACNHRECCYRFKSVQKGKIEPEFEKLLSNKKAGKDIERLAKAIFMDAWQEGSEEFKLDKQSLDNKIAKIDEQITNLADRVSTSTNQALITAYESKIAKLAGEMEEITSENLKPQYTKEQFGTALESVLQALENPLLLWKSDNMEDIRTVQYMYFDQPPRYDYEKGFGTVKYSDAIELFSAFGSEKTPSVETEGNEPSSAYRL